MFAPTSAGNLGRSGSRAAIAGMRRTGPLGAATGARAVSRGRPTSGSKPQKNDAGSVGNRSRAGTSPGSAAKGGAAGSASGDRAGTGTAGRARRFSATPTSQRSPSAGALSGAGAALGMLDPLEIGMRRIGNALLFLRKMTSQLYLTHEQAIATIQAFPARLPFARVEAAIVLFGRLYDLQHFWISGLDLLANEEATVELLNRLGWLNVANPDYPDRYFELDLSFRDDREVADVMTVLAVAEPGENFLGEQFANPKPIPGWELPESWYTTGPPNSGRLNFTYTSKGPGCLADWDTRASLRRRFLVFNNWIDWDPLNSPSVLSDEGGLSVSGSNS